MDETRKGIDFIGITCVFTCHDGEGNVLVSKRSQECRDEKGTWDQGAGSMEMGETAEETVTREIREEYCTDVFEIELLGVRDIHRENNGVKTHWICLDHLVHIDRSKVAIGEPHKTDELRWIKFSEMPTPTHSQFPFFVKKYKEQLTHLF